MMKFCIGSNPILKVKALLRVFILLSFLPSTAFSGIHEDIDRYKNESYLFGKALVHDKQPVLPREVLAKAVPDECFFGIGGADPENQAANSNIYDPVLEQACEHNKVNQSYVWGMVKTGDNLWFGTGANVHCLVSANYLGATDIDGENVFACEFEFSRYLPDLLNEIPALFRGSIDESMIDLSLIGDWRPPRIFVYNTRSKTLTEITPEYTPALGVIYSYPETLVNATIGIRSAGSLNNVVMMAGPSALGGIDMYAFDSRDGRYIGFANINTLPGENILSINNIRKWMVVNGALYTTVGVTYPDDSTGGKVLKWKGSVVSPFQFEVVGSLDSAGAELALHDGRLFISTWSGGGEMGVPQKGDGMSGVYMSPIIPAEGLNPQHKDQWTKVWEASDYEPSPLIAKTYGGGALVSYGGYLYWGTMHVPYLSFATTSGYIRALSGSLKQTYFPDVATRAVHYAYDETTYKDARNAFMNDATRRSITLFRGKDFGQETEKIELLYGQKELPVLVLTKDDIEDESGLEGYVEEQEIEYIATFKFVPNKMGGADPVYGPAGFGNPYNNYTWDMGVFNNELYVGTMNYAILEFTGEVPDDEHFAPSMGANLFRFPGADEPAVAENIDGMGNYSSYGIRNMISDDALYLGMANPMNILTDENGRNLGGWELIKLGNWTVSSSGAGKIEVEISDASGKPFIETIKAISSNSPEINQTGKPGNMSFPDGLVSIALKNLDHPGDTVQVTLTMPRSYPDTAKYYKITDLGYEEFKNPDGTPRYEFDGNTVTLTLTDGDSWDKDGEANGEIMDPGGAAIPAASSEPSPGAGGGGCFIAALLFAE